LELFTKQPTRSFTPLMSVSSSTSLTRGERSRFGWTEKWRRSAGMVSVGQNRGSSRRMILFPQSLRCFTSGANPRKAGFPEGRVFLRRHLRGRCQVSLESQQLVVHTRCRALFFPPLCRILRTSLENVKPCAFG
jgi:hypothetical protein